MSGEAKASWSDDQLVEHIGKWAIEQSKCGFDPVCANRINDDELVPCRDILASRGEASLLKLLPLLEDDNPYVRLNAASFTFAVAPAKCRKSLARLIREGGIPSLFAWAIWSHHDPETAPDATVLLDRPGDVSD